MKPLRERATEGRANPKGIPSLYLATDRETAIGEVRPWIGSHVSIGVFETRRELNTVNCTDHLRHLYVGGEPDAEGREEAVWVSIGEAFTRPVNPNDDVADYAPTQIIAELLKVNEFDGIMCRSSFGNKLNVVLFDIDAAELVQCQLFKVTGVTFNSEEIGQPREILP